MGVLQLLGLLVHLMSRSGMRAGSPTVYLVTAFVLMAIVVALAATHLHPSVAVGYQPSRDTSLGGPGPDWESKKCMRDTQKVEPFAFAVCYDR